MNLVKNTKIWRVQVFLVSKRSPQGFTNKRLFVVADTSSEARGKVKEWAKERKKVFYILPGTTTTWDPDQGHVPVDGIDSIWPVGGKRAVIII